MNKRGALFYIIDAFVAASVIAITISIVLSSFLNTPRPDDVTLAVDNYMRFFAETQINVAPGSVARSLRDNDAVSSRFASVFEVVVELVVSDREDLARDLVEELTNMVLEPQFGFSMTIHNGSDTFGVFNRSLSRRDRTKIHLSRQIPVSVVIESTVMRTDAEIILGSYAGNYKGVQLCEEYFDDQGLSHTCDPWSQQLYPGIDCCNFIIFNCSGHSLPPNDVQQIFASQGGCTDLTYLTYDCDTSVDGRQDPGLDVTVQCVRYRPADVVTAHIVEVSIWP